MNLPSKSIFFLLLLAGVPAAGQYRRSHYSHGGLRYAPVAGIASASMSWEQNRVQMDCGMRPGYMAGALLEMEIGNNVYFQPLLLLSGKGYRFSYDITSLVKKYYSIHYLDVPFTLKWEHTVNMTDFSFFAGPYFAYALWGKAKTVRTGESPEITPLHFGSSSGDDLKKMDAGLMMGTSIQVTSWRYMLYYSAGFFNVTPAEDNYMYTKFLCFSIAYMFN